MVERERERESERANDGTNETRREAEGDCLEMGAVYYM